MKKIIIIIIFFTGFQLKAQLVITPGAEIKMSGSALLTLQDIDMVNNGAFNQAEGTVRFSGNTNTNISGTQTTRFNILQVAKATNNQVLLHRNINTDNQIDFVSGNIDLNGFNINLAPTALLAGETETSRITGSTGGYIEITNTLNSPSVVNPGNLGVIISSSQNMGSTIIRRGHKSQINGYGNGNSIYRYYDITPANNTALNATLKMNYFDAELNGLTENTLFFQASLWHRTRRPTKKLIYHQRRVP